MYLCLYVRVCVPLQFRFDVAATIVILVIAYLSFDLSAQTSNKQCGISLQRLTLAASRVGSELVFARVLAFVSLCWLNFRI